MSKYWYTPTLVKANIWDKEMADAFSLTEPKQDPNHFDLMHSKMNPESIVPYMASDGYSNYSGGVIVKCNAKYPPPRTKQSKKDAYQKCLRDEQKAHDAKKDDKGKAGGFLGTGIGSGRRKECREAGLTGAEKRECARELRRRGWKKGQPIPPDMAGITPEDVVQSIETEPVIPKESESQVDTTSGKKELFDDKTKKILTYAGIAVVGVAGIIFISWGIGSMVKGAKVSTATNSYRGRMRG